MCIVNKVNINRLCVKLLAVLIVLFTTVGCSKIIEIPEPVNTITTPTAFSTEANATAALTGIYSDMSFGQNSALYANGGMTIFVGMSADEISPYGFTSTYNTNTLQSKDGAVIGVFWSPAYYNIYMANAVIEGLQASNTISEGVKNQLTGEAKFIRAFCHFYMVNLFGDVPLITSTSWAKTGMLKRTPVNEVYQQIVTDLKDAQELLSNDYSFAGGKRIRANKWAASALLARVYLYTEKWADAEVNASAVISNTNLFSLSDDLKTTFLANSTEAILQLQVLNIFPYATQEGQNFIPPDPNSVPNYVLTPELLASFDSGDKRRGAWMDSIISSGTYLYYPYKYKVRQGSSDISEYYMLLRLSEQYLIRAEARVRQNKLMDAISDLNIIRTRAGVTNLPISLNLSQIISAIAKERQTELFAEWGHRWFDLKRTGQADSVLAIVKQQWKPTAKLYPIPYSELLADPNLIQNPGY